MSGYTRRQLIASAIPAAIGLAAASRSLAFGPALHARPAKGENIAFGMVTYQWGRDFDLDTLLKTCAEQKYGGVELRTTHKHGVEPSLDEKQRGEVRQKFADSGVTCVGIGSDERFDNPDPAILKKAIEKAKEFIRLSHDIGGSGIKVKPDRFHEGTPREKNDRADR